MMISRIRCGAFVLLSGLSVLMGFGIADGVSGVLSLI